MYYRYFLILIFLVPLCALPQISDNNYDNIAQEIRQKALRDQKGYELLRQLCSIGPRLSGYPTSFKAIDWCEQTLESLGCDRVWLQSVMVPYWNRGEIEAAHIIESSSTRQKDLAIAALGGSIGTSTEGITAEILEVHSFEELKDKAEEAQGKIIFFNRPFDPAVRYSFSGYADAVKQRTEGASRAAEVGGVAALIRSVTSRNDNIPHTGIMYYKKGVKRIPAAAIGVSDADLLSRAIKNDPKIKVNIKLSCKNHPEVESFNVIGEIRGKKYPDDVIVVGGHLDAWDKGHGAHDDGAGVIHSLEVIYLFKHLNIQPSRTIRCVLFMDEEQKQSGAKAYGKYASYAPEKHIAAIESDRGGFTPRGFSITADSTVIEKIKTWLPFLSQATIEWVRKGGSGADISNIKNAKALIGYVPDSQRYFDVHHSASDVFASVHPREFELGSAAIAILAYLISEEGL